ncbi:ABC-type antimicrobial peptide transport system permease subunit [Anseongella ginsenosidimutans]|uniref:ABC-type antimicrobial peptide transport system permease subunit n=1 Tax=Anseongella ginsenosidimutans TaxID=496056 RepID=A0A4R3KXR9_9SPHI|nr:ABC transporter permease [Anseongella ginsenosidimutans]QEC51876.1 FtsX-like permease family protein [Anseongella ginsenosidimutans]TCS89260.1 ABC-type antimicrobial peptide transport system permease subunit [Anseongella ginsenosidimutans]
MLRNYFRTAFRALARNKVYSAINVAGLSMGLACCMLIVLYTKDEVSFDRFHEKKDQIFRVTATISGKDGVNKLGSTNQIVGPSFAAEIPEVEAFVRMETGSYILRRGAETFEEEILSADENFFSVFSFPLISGDAATALSGLQSMVLSEAAAEKYFGTTNVLGRTLELRVDEKFQPFQVTAVAKNPPQNSSLQFDILIPFEFLRSRYPDNAWVGFYINTFLVLRPGSDDKTVAPKLNQVFLSKAGGELQEMKEKLDYKDRVRFGLQPFPQIHLDTGYGDLRNGLTAGSNPLYSYILSGIALFILVIACINFVNLTIAHSLKRGKEIGIRKVIGGQRGQLAGQFLGESFILCLLAFAAAIAIAQLALPFFNELSNKRLSFSYLLDIKLITIYLALFLTTGLASGLYPALVLSGYKPVQTLYNRHHRTGRNYLARGLVILQFTLATFLMIATTGIYSQFSYLMHKDLGYNDEDLVIVHLGRGRHDAAISTLKNELAGESSITLTATKDFGGQSYTMAKVNNQEKEIYFALSWIDEQFLPALQIPILQGRNFSPDFPADAAHSVIINETFAKEAGWAPASGKDPIGQVINYGDEQLTVIGMVKDYHFTSLKEKIGPLLLKHGSGDLWVKLRPGKATQALKAIREAYEKVMPFRPFSYAYMHDINQAGYASEAKWKQMITAGAILSIFISCMGLFGLAMQSIQRRTKEVGIRKVMGAAVPDIVLLLSRDFLKLVALAFVLAIPLSHYAVSRWLQNFAYRIDLAWWIFGLAGLLALLIALLTVSFQSVKAALMNPVKSLRSE